MEEFERSSFSTVEICRGFSNSQNRNWLLAHQSLLIFKMTHSPGLGGVKIYQVTKNLHNIWKKEIVITLKIGVIYCYISIHINQKYIFERVYKLLFINDWKCLSYTWIVNILYYIPSLNFFPFFNVDRLN